MKNRMKTLKTAQANNIPPNIIEVISRVQSLRNTSSRNECLRGMGKDALLDRSKNYNFDPKNPIDVDLLMGNYIALNMVNPLAMLLDFKGDLLSELKGPKKPYGTQGSPTVIPEAETILSQAQISPSELVDLARYITQVSIKLLRKSFDNNPPPPPKSPEDAEKRQEFLKYIEVTDMNKLEFIDDGTERDRIMDSYNRGELSKEELEQRLKILSHSKNWLKSASDETRNKTSTVRSGFGINPFGTPIILIAQGYEDLLEDIIKDIKQRSPSEREKILASLNKTIQRDKDTHDPIRLEMVNKLRNIVDGVTGSGSHGSQPASPPTATQNPTTRSPLFKNMY